MITNNLKKRIFTSLLLFILFFLIYNFNFFLIYSLIVLGVLSLIEFYNAIDKIIKSKLLILSMNSIFSIFVSVFCYLFLFFSFNAQLKLILFIILLGCIFSDIGGYLFGKIFGGPKLTKISPNKTITGSVGSLLISATTVFVLFFIFFGIYSLNILFVGLITSLACQMGDLFFSYLKRKAKFKDFGKYLPGHGGVLDRLDGIFFGVPSGLLALAILN
jgi:phosphatidate cytidylyltransferase